MSILQLFEREILPSCQQHPVCKLLVSEVEMFIKVLPLVLEVSNKKVNEIFTLKEKGRSYNEHKSAFLADVVFTVEGIEKNTK